MVTFDIKTISGRTLSTILVGENETHLVGQRYNDAYLQPFREQHGEECYITCRVENEREYLVVVRSKQ